MQHIFLEGYMLSFMDRKQNIRNVGVLQNLYRAIFQSEIRLMILQLQL